jgi:Kef-type K+ transport system membrane component KefB
VLLFFDLTLPVKDPVLIFSLVLFIILLAPIVLQKFKIPGVVGLIIAGVLIGPHAFYILERDSSFELFGMVGLLYIMFLAGLELDLTEFKKNTFKSLVFGFFTFLIPQLIGTAVSYYLLQFNLMSSILLASMFASHTLIAYPVISRLGIARTEIITVIVGGTMVTNVIALMILSIITSMARGELGTTFWVEFVVYIIIYVLIIFLGIPKLARWFFKNFEGQGGSHYIFVLAVVFAASFFAHAANIEPIIGAFLAGLALNRLIPHTSPLMNRIDFIGNNLFIPFFLIGVGMLINLNVFFSGAEALMVATVMIVIALSTKWIAAWFTKIFFRYSKAEKDLIFGLSSAQAASTLAAVTIGFNLGLLNENVLNGTILMILATCLVSSFVTEKAGREYAIFEGLKTPDILEYYDRIMVPISNPATIETLLDLAIMVKEEKSREPIYALAVVKDDIDAKEKLIMSEKMLEKAINHASSIEQKVRIVTRVDLNIASGIIRAIKDMGITEVIIGWNAKIKTRDKMFGSVLDVLLENSGQMTIVSKIINPLNTFKKIIVAIPPNAEFEPMIGRWIKSVKSIGKQTGADLEFHLSESSKIKINELVTATKPQTKVTYKEFEDWENFEIFARHVNESNLLVVVSARKSTISYNHYLDNIPRKLSKHFENNSFLIIYPEQILEPEVFKHMQ